MGNSPLSEQDVVGHYDSLDELETYDSRQSSTLLSNIEMSENEPFIPDDYERLSLDDTESDFTQKKSWNEKQTWYTEAKYLVVNAFPMAVAFELEYCMPWTSLLLLGRLGKVELAAASVALVMSSMMGFSVLQGFVTALDTLCAQAFGSGHLRLVGMHTQRMILFLWLCCIPLAILLWNVEYILKIMVPEGETVALASQYIRIYILGLPSLAMFESLKRFLRAQGIYHPPALVLLFVTPLNVVSGWLLVWHSEIGFLGAPIALTVSHWVMTLLLIAYIYFVDGMRCWTPVTRDALRNWGASPHYSTCSLPRLISNRRHDTTWNIRYADGHE